MMKMHCHIDRVSFNRDDVGTVVLKIPLTDQRQMELLTHYRGTVRFETIHNKSQGED